MSDQLMLDAMLGRETERVPVAPLITLPHASRIFNIKPYEYIFNSEKYAAAQINARKFYNYDWVFAHQIFQGLTEREKKGIKEYSEYFTLKLELGTEFKIPKKAAPYITQKALEKKDEIDELIIPDTFHKDRLKPLRIMRKEEEFVCGNIRCPFTFASTYLYNTEDFYMDIKRDEEFVHMLTEFALRYCIDSGRAQIEAGVDAMFIEDPSASPDVISPETYKRTVLPFEKRLIKTLKKKVPVIFHICGDTSTILDYMIEAGANCISLDERMSMEEVHKKTPVWGNVAPKLLVNENPGRIREISDNIVGLGKGVILSSGCVVPANAKSENITQMVRAAHDN
jgi:MtaA/CmuA family methyltransferase